MPEANRDPHEAPSDKVDESRQVRRDVVVAGAVLGLVACALLFYSVLSLSSTDEPPKTKISAAAWVGAGEKDGGTADPAPAAAPPEKGGGYAPRPEDLVAPEPENPMEAEQEETLEVESSSTDGKVTKKGKVKKGEAVIKSLARMGLKMSDAHAVITALEGVFDFKRARPKETFEVRVDSKDGKPDYFRYDVSLTEVYEVLRSGDGLKGRKKYIPTEKQDRRFGGTIASSLYKALTELGAHPSLSGSIVEVLAHQVDFYKAQRPGDTFRVLVEEESLDGTFLGYGPVLALEYDGVKSGKKRFFRFETKKDGATYYGDNGISVPRSVISIPLHYSRISSMFGMRYHPILKRKQQHNGVDFSAPPGTPVWACQSGKITLAARKGANGNLVVIAHEDNLSSYYAHLQRFAGSVKPGVIVSERQVIGYVGSTGRSTGPHLHFGLKKNGRFIDPLKYKIRPGRPVAAQYKKMLGDVIAKWGRVLDETPIKPPASPPEETPDEEVLGLEELE
jgi:murein DD-endopeptidase MepM/ murein hydrolase activator NlpD